MEGKLVSKEEVLFKLNDIKAHLETSYNRQDLWWNTNQVDIGKGRTYVGQWKKDNHEDIWMGLGTITFSDGSKYQGFTKKGMFEGKGRITHANGDIYQGDWKQGKAQGQGVFVD